MSYLDKENEIRIDILDSLSRSQKALARIIESMGEASSISSPVRAELLDNIEVIGKYQMAIGDKIARMRIRRLRRGEPGAPWLNQDLLSNSR